MKEVQKQNTVTQNWGKQIILVSGFDGTDWAGAGTQHTQAPLWAPSRRRGCHEEEIAGCCSPLH